MFRIHRYNKKGERVLPARFSSATEANWAAERMAKRELKKHSHCILTDDDESQIVWSETYNKPLAIFKPLWHHEEDEEAFVL